jgi:hypothetical protein
MNYHNRQGGILKAVHYMFWDCTRPRAGATQDDDDEQDEWDEVPLNHHHLDIRHDNGKWHFWDDEVVDHDCNLTE